MANPATLIRRVSLDLIGLPPSPKEVQDFVNAWGEDSETVWTDLVDRLLESEHYGERWGRWWLDQARYADSNGYSIDARVRFGNTGIGWLMLLIGIYPLINLPLNNSQVICFEASLEQKIATGFHRNTQINQEGY